MHENQRMGTAHHDFAESLVLARSDSDLKEQLLNHFGADDLSAADKSPLVQTTSLVMTWVIQHARSMYKAGPENLVATISSSEKSNALAVWSRSGRDWIVFSEGLMGRLRDGAESMADRFASAFPDLTDTALMKQLLAQEPLSGGFKTALSSFLYFAAVAFVAGHEAGHHLAGHCSQYPKLAHAESEGSDALVGEDRLTAQALERDADRLGLILCRVAITKLLSQLWTRTDAEALSTAERRTYQRVLATLISTGALATAVFIQPKTIDWDALPNASHPPAVARILTLSEQITQSIKENFDCLESVYLRRIRIMSLEVAAGASIESGTKAAHVEQERLARGGEPAAIRATGIRKALYDATFPAYVAQLDAKLREIRPLLQPRM